MEKHSISVWATYPRHLANTFHLWSISLSTKTSFGILKKCLLSEAWVFTETERNTKWPEPRRATHPLTLTTTTEGQRGVKNLHLIDNILRAGNRFFLLFIITIFFSFRFWIFMLILWFCSSKWHLIPLTFPGVRWEIDHQVEYAVAHANDFPHPVTLLQAQLIHFTHSQSP